MARARPRRLLVVFVLAVFVPALALAVLSYRSVAKERRALLAERESGIRRAAWLLRREMTAQLAALRTEEEDRPWYQYNRWFYDPSTKGGGVNYIQSPIAGVPPHPLVDTYFNIRPDFEVDTPQAAAIPGAQSLADAPQPQQHDEQNEIEQRALDNVALLKGGFVQNFDRNGAFVPGGKRGEFPGVAQQSKKQQISRKGAWANTETAQKLQAMDEGGQVDLEGSRAFQEEPLEVVLSPLLFERDPRAGLLAYRYVDVPNEGKAFGGRPFLRYVQGFRIDEARLAAMFGEYAGLYADLPGVHAALVPAGGTEPEGEVVVEDTLDLLPDSRIVVSDADPGWVSRRVSRLATTLLAIAAGLLAVIAGGLAFTLRTVRTEVDLARRKSDFVASVTHELRTPLTGIRMYADLLKEGWVRDEATRDEYVGFMASEADRLTRLVNRVLDFARSDRGEPRPVEPVDLAEVVGEVERSFGPQVRERGFELEIDAADAPPALADRDAVKQILLNLLENAVKYAGGTGEPRIAVRLAGEGARVALSVEDHGPGVPRAERGHVFEDFYRPGEELTRETTGAGIGLALVRRLARSMGGEVELAETPGGGATFRVLLRRAPI